MLNLGIVSLALSATGVYFFGDADGDGKRNYGADDCPMLPANTSNGCPRGQKPGLGPSLMVHYLTVAGHQLSRIPGARQLAIDVGTALADLKCGPGRRAIVVSQDDATETVRVVCRKLRK